MRGSRKMETSASVDHCASVTTAISFRRGQAERLCKANRASIRGSIRDFSPVTFPGCPRGIGFIERFGARCALMLDYGYLIPLCFLSIRSLFRFLEKITKVLMPVRKNEKRRPIRRNRLQASRSMKKSASADLPQDLASLLRGMYGRVARQLHLDPSYVSRVARGERRSELVKAALRRELNKIVRHAYKKHIGFARSEPAARTRKR